MVRAQNQSKIESGVADATDDLPTFHNTDVFVDGTFNPPPADDAARAVTLPTDKFNIKLTRLTLGDSIDTSYGNQTGEPQSSCET